MNFYTKHEARDLKLPELRSELLVTALHSLKTNPNVIAVFLGGSLAKGNEDLFSDIDLRIIVDEGKYSEYIQKKQHIASEWGEVLFFEDMNPSAPFTIAHYDCFVKVDVFFYTVNRLQPSIWLKDIKVLFDPEGIVNEVIIKSQQLHYDVSAELIAKWRGKVFSYIHEIYRRVQREEYYYALGQINNLRAFIVNGWNMEFGRHSNDAWDWSKVEGERSELELWQLTLLENWSCGRDQTEIMNTLLSMIPEITRLHNVLCDKTGLNKDSEIFNKVIELVL
jgi:predicted nucleotidyltransferase